MPKGIYKPLTEEQEQFIKDNYLLMPIKRIADKLGTTFGTVMRRLDKWDLIIPEEIKLRNKKQSEFKNGQKPFNKGLKQKDFMSKESLEKTKKTRFKKGNNPHNSKYDGAITIRKESNCDIHYKYVRISKGKWQLLQRTIWEREKNQKLKPDEIIIFKDGDTMNCDISNLQKITKVENMFRNSKINYPKEIIPSLVLVNQLNKKINNG